MSLPELKILNPVQSSSPERWRPLSRIFGLGVLLAGALSVSAVFSAPEAVAGHWCDLGADESLEQKLERSRGRALFATDLMLRWLDTTDDQRERIKDRLERLMADIDAPAMVQEHCDNRDQILDVFMGEISEEGEDRGPIDTNKMIQTSFLAFGLKEDPQNGRWYLDEEKAERLKLMVTGVADMANELSADQRQELIEIMQDFHSNFGRNRGFNRF